jgi:hypothetical protein
MARCVLIKTRDDVYPNEVLGIGFKANGIDEVFNGLLDEYDSCNFQFDCLLWMG